MPLDPGFKRGQGSPCPATAEFIKLPKSVVADVRLLPQPPAGLSTGTGGQPINAPLNAPDSVSRG